jgi:hypothetical protein
MRSSTIQKRPSILNIKNIEFDFLNPTRYVKSVSPGSYESSPRLSFSKQNLKSMRSIPTLEQKISRLKLMTLNFISNQNPKILPGTRDMPKSNICISELWGSKETYLKNTGYLEAYKELNKKYPDAPAKKIKKPLNDINTKAKALINFRVSEHNKNQLPTIFETKDGQKKTNKTSEIDIIINECSKFTKRNSKFINETSKIKSAMKIMTKKKSSSSLKLSGLSKSTSEELIKSIKQ